MAITLECPNGHKLRVRDDLAGKKVRCPKCQALVRVDQDAESGNPAQESEEIDFASFGEAAGNEMRLPELSTRSSRPKKSPARAGGSGWKIPLMFGGGGLATAIVILIVVIARKPAFAPVANATEAARAQHAPEATPERVASAAVENPISNVEAARPGQPQSSVVAKVPPHSFALAREPRAAVTAPVGPERAATGEAQNKQPDVPVLKGVVVWDTVEPGRQADGLDAATARADGWERVTPNTGASYRFRGDCVIENENLQLRAPRNEPGKALVSAKGGVRQQATVPISIIGHGAKPGGSVTIRVASLTGDSATIEYGAESSAGGPRVAFSVESGKYWVEVKPLVKADRLAIGVKSQFVVVPSAFGEDLICDALLFRAGQSFPIPNENLVLALQCDGNFMTVLTYPSIDQAGTVAIGAGDGVQNHGTALNSCVSAVSAKFNGKSVFVGIVPQKDCWYYEPVNKKYSASGQYNIRWRPQLPGVWRLAGRVNGKYFVSDVPDDNFEFACSFSGTLDCLFGYFNGSSESSATGTVTPTVIYREMLERTQESDPLLKAEENGAERSLMRRKTRYRDVCNSVDDMKDTWRNKRERLENEPDYVGNLLADCKAILERMDGRICEYRDLTEHVGEVVAEMKQKEGSKEGGAELRTFSAAAQRSEAKLKAFKPVAVTRGVQAVEKIEQKLRQRQDGRLNLAELDRIAESMRDVANHQEEQLKKLRAIALQLAQVCTKQRKAMPPTLKPYVTAIGSRCRKVLRNRDPEE